MLFLAQAVFLAQPVFADPPTAPKVKEMIAKTRKVVVHAAKVVKENKGTGKEDLRKAVVNNKAARSALKKQKLGVAAHLTLKARGFARDAVKANKGAKEPPADTKDTPTETAAAESADPKEVDTEVADADKSTPPDATEDSGDSQ